MGHPLAQLRPRPVWEHFSSIAAIPRPSKHEEKIVGWVRSLAEQHGWEVRSDAVGNLVLAVPASAGCEEAPIVVLQAHLDMVCEKNEDVDHDFMTDPIRPRVVADWVYASGTTLGADNGLGVAAALAAATDPSVRHGPLELLFTIDEETGLTGAQGLDAAILNGRLLINLDSEEDGTLFVGCAGGADCTIYLDSSRKAPEDGTRPLRITVKGLRGGHSGLNIHENRGNAVKLLTRLLLSAAESGISLEIADLHGGSKHNAIPREAEATVFTSDVDALRGVAQCMLEAFRGELKGIDDGVEVRVEEAGDAEASVMSSEDADRLLRLLSVIPHGVLAMSPDVPGLVETSNNLAAVRPVNGRIEIVASARSSINSVINSVLSSLRSAAALAGAQVENSNAYPGWKPDLESRALEVVRGVWTELHGKPEVTAVHAGLECGLLGQKVPGLDMISFGPQIEGAHSPDERVQVSSVQRFWTALVRVLETLAER